MSYKSRGNWCIGFCTKGSKCRNKDLKCKECFRFSEYIEKPIIDINKIPETSQPATGNFIYHIEER